MRRWKENSRSWDIERKIKKSFALPVAYRDRVNWLFIFSKQTSFFSSRCLPINSHHSSDFIVVYPMLYATKFTLQRHKTKKFLSWKIEGKKWQNFYLLLLKSALEFLPFPSHTHKREFFAYINLIIKPFFSFSPTTSISFLSNKILLDVFVLHCAGSIFYLSNLTKTLS